MAARRAAPLSFGIFAEGATSTDLRGRDTFVDLWKTLCGRLKSPLPEIHVFGISKAQIVALRDDVGAQKPDREPLDLLLQRMHARHGFNVAVVAFDRIPQNQHIPGDCMRREVNFILERFRARALVPDPFRDEATRLLDYYRMHPEEPRGPGRPPRGCLDVVYMDPMFEALFLADETAVLRSFGHKRRPKDWPSFDPHLHNPDHHVLGPAVDCASPVIRAKVRGNFVTNKHGWAKWILAQAADDAGFFGHAIAERLRIVLG
ncbi:MAG: hypothetical protein ACMG6S_05370 [Byssovorax sp.]